MLRLLYKVSLMAALIFFTSATTPARALDWHDPEWTGLGCPSKLSGDWFPLTDSPYAGLKFEFKYGGAALSSKGNSRIVHTFFQNPKDGQYVNLKRVSGDPDSFPKYIKIRPHLAVQNVSEGKKHTHCKIKVFLFESKQKANQMSYLSWDIYSIIAN